MSEHVGAALERAGALFGKREAVVDGDLRWSYAELRRRAAAFDAALEELGLAEGDVVGVLGLNSAAHLVAWLGATRGGRVLNDLNVRLARPRSSSSSTSPGCAPCSSTTRSWRWGAPWRAVARPSSTSSTWARAPRRTGASRSRT